MFVYYICSALLFVVVYSYQCINFSSKCSCGISEYYGKQTYITNCTNAGFTNNDAGLLEKLPLETEVFIFTGNNITELPLNIFGSIHNYTKLKVIDMSNNNIEEIKGKTFHHVPYVERLILNHNSISLSSQHPRLFSNFQSLIELHLTNAFLDNSPDNLASDLHNIFINSSLTHLVKLHLEQNEIVEFKDGRIFCDLPTLMDLHLGNNRLSRLDFEIKCLLHLRFVDLEANQISYFPDKDLSTFDAFPARSQKLTIDISNNPLSCSCKMRTFVSWLNSTKVVVRNKDQLYCNNNSDFINGNVSYTQLMSKCQSDYTKTNNHIAHHNSIANSVILIFVLVLVACLLFIIVKQYSEYCRHTSVLANKVHYSIIGRPEEQEAHV